MKFIKNWNDFVNESISKKKRNRKKERGNTIKNITN